MLGKQHRQLCHSSRRAVAPAVVRAQARRPTRHLVHPHAAAHAGCDSSLEECFAEPSSYTHSTLLHLFESVRAHESSLSAGIVVHDLAQGEKIVVTASLDKTIAAWRLAPNQDADPMRPYYCEVQKIAAPGGPIFSIAPARPLFHQCTERKSASPGASPSSSSSPAVNTIFCGNAAKEVVSWQPLVPTFDPLKLDGHSGWVRGLATYDKYLISSGGSVLQVWDCTYASPKMVSEVKLFTGDILEICVGSGFVYTGGADGSLRCWSIDKNKGSLTEVAAVEKAHAGRISSMVRHNGYLYSSGADGSISLWIQGTLQPVTRAEACHGPDSKVHCMAVAGNGVLYSGGDDQLIRAWDPATLEPMPDFEPLRVHNSAVRMLVAGKSEMLVSGDAEGYVNFFRVPAPPPPPPAESAPVVELCADLMHEVRPLTPEETSCELYPGTSSSEATAAAEAGLAVQALMAAPVKHPQGDALSSADSFSSLIPAFRIGPEDFSKELDPASSASSSSSSSGDSMDVTLQAGIVGAVVDGLEALVSTEAVVPEGLLLDEAPPSEGKDHSSSSGSSNGTGHSAAAAVTSAAGSAAVVTAAASTAHQEADHQPQPNLLAPGIAASESGSEDEALIPPSV